jgi:orotidine-5'-phosphate decarboxylase
MAELVVALDVQDEGKLRDLLAALKGQPVWMKVGLEALSAFGLGLVGRLAGEGFKVFADVKYHDIPNTVGSAARVITRTGADMFNVHCSGGAAMCAAALKESEDEAARIGKPRPIVLGVTVLTSLGQEDLSALGWAGSPQEAALRYAKVGQAGGLDGVVASVHEAAAIKAACGAGFKVLTPGIRPAGGDTQDQKRVATPASAVAAGADYLVVGRPITGASDPASACSAILAEMRG